MLTLRWDESLSVGVRMMDVEHKRLVFLLRRLANGLKSGDDENLLKNLDNLAEKAANHFLHEERLLRLTDFAATVPHEREHAKFLHKIRAVQLGLRAGDAGALSKEVVHSLGDWLEQHIKDCDKEFSAYLNLRGIR